MKKKNRKRKKIMNEEDYKKYKKAEAKILENNDIIQALVKKRDQLQEKIILKKR